MYDNGLTNNYHHVDLAKGGVALTTVSYGAVSPRKNLENQMYIVKVALKE